MSKSKTNQADSKDTLALAREGQKLMMAAVAYRNVYDRVVAKGHPPRAGRFSPDAMLRETLRAVRDVLDKRNFVGT
jgi:hypothetical protein